MIITLLRKPLEGSVAENTLQHGCGAINIDATRVSTSDNLNGGAYAENPTERGGEYEQPSGRWPANFILTHLEGCERKGTKKVKGHKNSNGMTNQGFGENGIYGKASPTKLFEYTDEEGKEDVADWACVEGCPVREMDQQSGHLKSTTRKPTGNPIYPTSNTSVTWNANNVMDTTQRGFNDEGGASRFFMQFQKGDNN